MQKKKRKLEGKAKIFHSKIECYVKIFPYILLAYFFSCSFSTPPAFPKDANMVIVNNFPWITIA